MQTSLYAFIPFGVLLGIALIAATISLWPRAGLREIEGISKKPRRSAEIIRFPGRGEQAATLAAASRYRKG